jgi:hypothetical protein
VGFDLDPEYLRTAVAALSVPGGAVPDPTPPKRRRRARNPSLM